MRSSGSRAAVLAWAGVLVAGVHGTVLAEDCNLNGVSDLCDVDCTAVGCDPATCGYSADTDYNGIPDECEGAPTSVTFTTTADFTAGPSQQGGVKSINLDAGAVDQLQRSELPQPLPFLWVAASVNGTVVKVDTATGDILGEYRSGPAFWVDGTPPVSTYDTRYPSRTAVNLDGEVWVGNKKDTGGSGSVVKIGLVIGGTPVNDVCAVDNRVILAPPFEYNTCVDRDGDGYITTSNGLSPLPWPNDENADSAGGVSTAVDECILQYVRAGGELTRYVAVDNDNNVWVGSHDSYNMFELVDGFTGAILEPFGRPSTFAVGCGGYGGIVDCNNVLWSASQYPHGERMFRYDTADDPADPDCCDAGVLADLNGDGVIDDGDDGLQQTEYVIFPVNSDDDNGNGYPDYEDAGPVDYEDDLAEIELATGCYVDDPQAWWMMSWTDPDPDGDPATDTIKIWADPQKSDGNGNPGNPVVNDVHYTWPPQPSVWVEALEAFDEIEISFTINYDEGRAQKTGTVKAKVTCTPGRQSVNAQILYPEIVTGISGVITSRTTVLCNEAEAGNPKHAAGSAAWVGVVLLDLNDPQRKALKWAQMGYSRRMHPDAPPYPPAPNPTQAKYAETRSGSAPTTDPSSFDIKYVNGYDSGAHEFKCILTVATGQWMYYYDNVLFHASPPATHAGWVTTKGNSVMWTAEIWNLQDRLVGVDQNRCVFSDCKHRFYSANLEPAELFQVNITTPDADEWGIELVDTVGNPPKSDKFQVWDKVVPP